MIVQFFVTIFVVVFRLYTACHREVYALSRTLAINMSFLVKEKHKMVATEII